MATYKEIKGTGFQNFSSDPGNLINGQVWYNTGSSVLKVTEPVGASWATGGNMSTARLAWTGGGNLADATYTRAGSGTQTAGLIFGSGQSGITGPSQTEEYDGSSWTSVNAPLNSSRTQFASGVGTQTAALAFGSSPNSTESYNGTAWTNLSAALTVPRYYYAGCGTQTAALCFGVNGGSPAATEEWNGSSWTNGGNLNTGRGYLAAFGTQTDAIGFAGKAPGLSPVITAVTEAYDGTSWTNSVNMNTARFWLSSTGPTPDSGLAIGGGPPNGSYAGSVSTEEFTGVGFSAETITTS